MRCAAKSCVTTVIVTSSFDMTFGTAAVTYGRVRAGVLMLAIAAALAGCGYKGPLYLPSSKPGATKPIPMPPPGPERPVPGEAAPPPQ